MPLLSPACGLTVTVPKASLVCVPVCGVSGGEQSSVPSEGQPAEDADEGAARPAGERHVGIVRFLTCGSYTCAPFGLLQHRCFIASTLQQFVNDGSVIS